VPKFADPNKVSKKIYPVAHKLKLPVGIIEHPVFHSSLLKAYKPDSTDECTIPIPEPVSVDRQVE
jgi:hypothetical protein